MEQTVKKKFGIRDIMTIAAMMVITYLIAMVIGSVTLPFPVVYLYGSAGIDAFIGAIFYLVAANRVNKHGLLFAWAAVYGIIQGVMGYMFLIPYFLVVALIAELFLQFIRYLSSHAMSPKHIFPFYSNNYFVRQVSKQLAHICIWLFHNSFFSTRKLNGANRYLIF